MTIAPDILDSLPPLAYGAVRDMVHDGDILLCSADEPASRAIRWATRSPWSHIAVAFRLRDIDRVMVLECVERLGVRAVPLSDFIRQTSSGRRPYPGRILLARHAAFAGLDRPQAMRAMSGFAFDRLGRRFSQIETIKIALRIACGRLNIHLPGRLAPDDEYICSEYVAGCFDAVGITIPWDGLGFIAPADFARDPRVFAVAQIRT